jgi:hypothetical protein
MEMLSMESLACPNADFSRFVFEEDLAKRCFEDEVSWLFVNVTTVRRLSLLGDFFDSLCPLPHIKMHSVMIVIVSLVFINGIVSTQLAKSVAEKFCYLAAIALLLLNSALR